jgi:hypothetical protein
MASILENRIIIILISMIWGFGLALLFRKICQNYKCVIVKVPPIFNNENNVIYDRNNRCYKLQKYPSQCVY